MISQNEIILMKQSEQPVNENYKGLYAITNPSNNRDKGWMYNVFFGGTNKSEKHTDKIKTNWILSLTDKEVEELEKRGCTLYKLNDSEINIIKNETNDTTVFIDGFRSMYFLFNELMNDSSIKKKIQKLLSKDGNPTKDYEFIMNAIKELKNGDIK